MPQAKILIAATEHGQNLARRALSPKYDLTFASTMAEAERLLRDSEMTVPERRSSFDLVICSVHFDDSRMYELLQHIRNVDHYDKLPFLVITAVPSAVALDGGVKMSAELLGAYGFLQLSALPQEEAEKTLLQTVEQGFGKPVKEKRIDKKAPKEK